MQKKQKHNLIWFRNDLRVTDNENIAKAVACGLPILAIYCFDMRHFQKQGLFYKTDKFRANFILESVADLKKSLSTLGIDLIVKYGLPEQEIYKLSEQAALDTIFLQNEWTSEEVAVEQQLQQLLKETIQFEKSYSQFLFQPEDYFEITTSIPNSFTSFRKKVEKYLTVREEFTYTVSKELQSKAQIFPSDEVSLQTLGFNEFKTDKRSAFPFRGGETAGLARIEDYIFKTHKVLFYKETRNGLVGVNYSTKFSSWLANGTISAVTIYNKIKQYERLFEANQSTYWVIFELLWRDFFKFVSIKHQNAIFFEGGIQNREIPWLYNEEVIEQWINGQTACDFVNANMIELKETGWMSNRGRQNVASYFAKELYQDWRVGAKYFESMLIDYDVHSNYGNWMYVAGVGNDGKDRKFNTHLQAKNYDGNRKFRKKWLQTKLF